MDILIGILLLVLLAFYFRYIRDKPANNQATQPAANPAATKSANAASDLDGAECIYTDGSIVCRARIFHAEVQNDQIQIRMKPLKSMGLSEVPDDSINVESPWRTLEHSGSHLYAPYANWKIFLDRKLITEVTELGQQGEDLETIKRSLLEHRKKTAV